MTHYIIDLFIAAFAAIMVGVNITLGNFGLAGGTALFYILFFIADNSFHLRNN